MKRLAEVDTSVHTKAPRHRRVGPPQLDKRQHISDVLGMSAIAAARNSFRVTLRSADVRAVQLSSFFYNACETPRSSDYAAVRSPLLRTLISHRGGSCLESVFSPLLHAAPTTRGHKPCTRAIHVMQPAPGTLTAGDLIAVSLSPAHSRQNCVPRRIAPGCHIFER